MGVCFAGKFQMWGMRDVFDCCGTHSGLGYRHRRTSPEGSSSVKSESEVFLEMASEKDVRWTKEQTRRLIDLIRTHGCLWDSRLKEYKDQMKRRLAYKAIAAQLNMPVESIKTKVHRLRAQHCGERSKLKKRQNVNCSENCNKSKWEYFEALNFLFNNNGDGNAVDSMDAEKRCTAEASNQNTEIPDTESEDFQKETDFVDFTDEDMDMTDESILPICSTPIRKISWPPKPRRHYSNERSRKSYNNRCTQISNESKLRDEDEIFAEYVISELKILNDDLYLKFKLRNGIKKLILEISEEHAKKRFLSLPETTSTLLTTSEMYSPFISPPQSNSSAHSFEILSSTTRDGKNADLKHSMFDEDIDKILGK